MHSNITYVWVCLEEHDAVKQAFNPVVTSGSLTPDVSGILELHGKMDVLQKRKQAF